MATARSVKTELRLQGDIDKELQAAKRLARYRVQALQESTRLLGDHASLLEGFVHMSMSLHHPDLRLDLPSNQQSDTRREKYATSALNHLIEFLEFGATRALEQISSGHTALRLQLKQRNQKTPLTKDEQNSSLSLCPVSL